MFTWILAESAWDQYWEDGVSKEIISGFPGCRRVDGFTNHATCGRHGGTPNHILPGLSFLSGEGEDSANRCQCRRHLVLAPPKEMEDFLIEEGVSSYCQFDRHKPIWYAAQEGKVCKLFFDASLATRELEKHRYLKKKGITTGTFRGKYFSQGACLTMDYLGEPITRRDSEYQGQIYSQMRKRIQRAGIDLEGVDWNPENILEDSGGRVWMIDFESWRI